MADGWFAKEWWISRDNFEEYRGRVFYTSFRIGIICTPFQLLEKCELRFVKSELDSNGNDNGNRNALLSIFRDILTLIVVSLFLELEYFVVTRLKEINYSRDGVKKAKEKSFYLAMDNGCLPCTLYDERASWIKSKKMEGTCSECSIREGLENVLKYKDRIPLSKMFWTSPYIISQPLRTIFIEDQGW